MVTQRITAADEARYRALNDSFLPTTVTIPRTGLNVPCRITPDTRQMGLTGLPEWQRVPRFRVAFTADENVVVGDHLVAGSRRYCLTEDENTDSYNYATLGLAVLFSVSGTGSVKRNPTSIAPAQTAGFVTVVADAQFRNITPLLLSPVNSQFVSDTFGVDITQPAWLLMDYPDGNTARFPVQVGDIITIGASTYPVRMVLPASGFLVLYVDTSRSS